MEYFRRMKAKRRLLNYLCNKGFINEDNYYVITIESNIKLQGCLNDKTIKEMKSLIPEADIEWESKNNWMQGKYKNFEITLTL